MYCVGCPLNPSLLDGANKPVMPRHGGNYYRKQKYLRIVFFNEMILDGRGFVGSYDGYCKETA